MALPTTEPRDPVTGSSKYTYSQLQDLWKSVGGSAIAAPFAAAVAMAESGGNSNSFNSNGNGSTDRGLWQINSVHGSLSTFDPIANARAAVQISSNGTNWRPWCVAWSNGKCGGSFLGTGAPVFGFFTGNPSDVGMSTPSTSPGTVPEAQNASVGSVLNPQTWAQAFLRPIFVSLWFGGMTLLGVVLVVAGIMILASESKAADIVRSLGGKVLKSTPQTAVVGAAVSAKQAGKKTASLPKDEKPQPPERQSESPAEREIRERKERSPDDLGY